MVQRKDQILWPGCFGICVWARGASHLGPCISSMHLMGCIWSSSHILPCVHQWSSESRVADVRGSSLSSEMPHGNATYGKQMPWCPARVTAVFFQDWAFLGQLPTCRILCSDSLEFFTKLGPEAHFLGFVRFSWRQCCGTIGLRNTIADCDTDSPWVSCIA